MKITPKATSYIIIIAIIQLLLEIFTMSLKMFDYMPMVYIGRLMINVIMEMAYLSIILYLYYLLKYINEGTQITNSFLVYIGFNLFVIVLRLFIPYPMNMLFFVLGVLSGVITLYFITQLFNVNNKSFKSTFKLLGYSMLFATIFKGVGSLLTIQHWTNYGIPVYAIILKLLSAVILILILVKIVTYLNKEQQTFKLAASESDE